MILNIVLLVWSILICFLYLIYVENRFGKKSSISTYAGPLTKNGLQFLTYIFIWLGLCFPLAWVADHWLTSISATFLALDGLFTGYNPTHLKRKWQDIIHIIGVQGAIGIFIIGLFFINWIVALCTMPLGILAIMYWIKKWDRHTYWIEIYFMVWLWVFLIIDKILLS